ncbi:hypothetical protein TVAG_181870 [Trichomonas vaginalis G3]|uniref:DUF3447 domain-containing protein n=1 Tax=Trichomonas vaginalis (strain ATCC PRA-98 / G3) TaxID=412133 RepID=A2F6W9_TRIV3|nr:spectrin binding [Trichomonas vaginalis G3]EAX99330.1 hypothetical protein TVAG_181870 [Trichomonas vaginalis G3]KAI5538980.1 spectrin binding [Trichomonas vaginalis G3]|eukprot:XP_001312260.1 hypothetical protein [Trichomonas vaginalis G3]
MDDDKNSFVSFIENADFDPNQRLICDLYPFSEDGYSLLEYCCYHGAIECFNLLRTKCNSEITEYCLQFSFLGRNQDIINECLKMFKPDPYCMTCAIATHNIILVKDLISKHGLNINLEDCWKFYNLQAFFIYLETSKDINNCFVCSPKFYLPSLCEYLINIGADINAKDKNGHSALYFAKENGNREISEFLISIGAKVEEQDLSLQTSNDYNQDGINIIQNAFSIINQILQNGVINPASEKEITELLGMLHNNFSGIIHNTQTESIDKIQTIYQNLLEKHTHQIKVKDLSWQKISRFFHQYDPEEHKSILNIVYTKKNHYDQKDIENANQIVKQIIECTNSNNNRPKSLLKFIENCYTDYQYFGNKKFLVDQIQYFFAKKPMEEFLSDVYSNEVRLCNFFKKIVHQDDRLSIIIAKIILDDNSMSKQSEYTFDGEGKRQFQADKLAPDIYSIRYPLIYKNAYRTYQVNTSGIYVKHPTDKKNNFSWINILKPHLDFSIKISRYCISKLFDCYKNVPTFNSKIVEKLRNKVDDSTLQEIQNKLNEINELAVKILNDEESKGNQIFSDLTNLNLTKKNEKNLDSLYVFRERLFHKNNDLFEKYCNFVDNCPYPIEDYYDCRMFEDLYKLDKEVTELHKIFATIAFYYLIRSTNDEMKKVRFHLKNLLTQGGFGDDRKKIFDSATDTSALISIAESARTKKSLVFALVFFHLLRNCPDDANVYDDIRNYHLLSFMWHGGTDQSKNLSLKMMEIDYNKIYKITPRK